MSRNQYRVGQIRIDNEALILQAAEQEFARVGCSGTSISRIAQEAGVPRSNVHYYFSSKEALYQRLLTNVLDVWNRSFPYITPEDDPAQALGEYIRAKLDFSRNEPNASKIFANEILRGAPLLKAFLQENYSTWLKRKQDVIQQWIAQGKMDDIDPLNLLFMIWATTQHYADFDVQVKTALGRDDYTEEDFARITRTVKHIILKGCGLTPGVDTGQ